MDAERISLLNTGIGIGSKHRVIEIDSFVDIEPYLHSEQLHLFDLDNTIMRPTQLFPSDQWFGGFLQHLRAQPGMDASQALQQAVKRYNFGQQLTRVLSVERDTPHLLKKWFKHHHFCLGLTARGACLYEATQRQLASIGVQFPGTNLPSFLLSEKENSAFIDGIIYCDGADKGKCLTEVLSVLKLVPKRVLFVDDKLNNVNRVKKALQPSTHFTGLRYGRLDEFIKSVDLPLAERQWRAMQQAAYSGAATKAPKLR